MKSYTLNHVALAPDFNIAVDIRIANTVHTELPVLRKWFPWTIGNLVKTQNCPAAVIETEPHIFALGLTWEAVGSRNPLKKITSTKCS